jgi:hypothetical protein
LRDFVAPTGESDGVILYIVLGLAVGVGGLGLVGTFGILSFLGMPMLIVGLSLISAGVGPTSASATGAPRRG